MFTNFQAYIKMRQKWRESVDYASTVVVVISYLLLLLVVAVDYGTTVYISSSGLHCSIPFANRWAFSLISFLDFEHELHAVQVEDLKNPLVVFEEAMKHSRMKQGWAASSETVSVRATWVKDVCEVATLLQMLYQIKMLTWFIGRRQSPRSSRKIAPLFNGTGEIRMTRARAGIVKVSLQARKKGCTMCTFVRMRCRLAGRVK